MKYLINDDDYDRHKDGSFFGNYYTTKENIMYICIERKNEERIVVSASACKFRINKKQTEFIVEGPRDAYEKYDTEKDCIFFTSNEMTVVKFISRKPINDRDVEFLNTNLIWDLAPKKAEKKKR